MGSLRFRFFDDLVVAYLSPNLVIILDTSGFISLSLLYSTLVHMPSMYAERRDLPSFVAP